MGERALQHLARKLNDLLYGERRLFRQDLAYQPYHHWGELRVGERALQHLARKLDDLLYGERRLFRQDLSYRFLAGRRRKWGSCA